MIRACCIDLLVVLIALSVTTALSVLITTALGWVNALEWYAIVNTGLLYVLHLPIGSG